MTEREQFEEFALEAGLPMDQLVQDGSGGYNYVGVTRMWAAWKASAALRAEDARDAAPKEMPPLWGSGLEDIARDAARYRFLRDAQVYDTGMAVADLPTEQSARGVKLLEGSALDVALDREMPRYWAARAMDSAP